MAHAVPAGAEPLSRGPRLAPDRQLSFDIHPQGCPVIPPGQAIAWTDSAVKGQVPRATELGSVIDVGPNAVRGADDGPLQTEVDAPARTLPLARPAVRTVLCSTRASAAAGCGPPNGSGCAVGPGSKLCGTTSSTPRPQHVRGARWDWRPGNRANGADGVDRADGVTRRPLPVGWPCPGPALEPACTVPGPWPASLEPLPPRASRQGLPDGKQTAPTRLTLEMR